ncbi:hypothetical protein U8M34_28345, partial [Klebsiella pneumoniae]|uniref:hypothetical protein n=1 Tax=Klebsiella pneumoniae TaxID=573 RepID=UPI002ADFFC6E
TSTYIEAKGKKTAGNVTQTLQLNWTCCAARAIVTNYVAKGSYRLADVDPATGLSQYRLIDFLYGYKSSDAAIPRVGGATFD